MVKPGYKQSEVGIIPEDWGVSALRAAFPKLEAGVSVNSDNMTSSKYHVLKTSAVHNGIVDPAEVKPVIKADYGRLKCPVVQGSIIISRMNTPALVGECGYVKNAPIDVYLPDRLWQVQNPKDSDYNFEWLNYLLNTKRYRDAVRATATGTSNSMKNISKERLMEIDIPCLSLDEQNRISAALSDIDTLIANLEKLIAKKKAIKQGAMQELLTGKQRLPGFDGKWADLIIGQNGYLLRETIDPQAYVSTLFWEYSMPAFDTGKEPVKTFGADMHSNRTVIRGSVLLFNKLNVRQKRIWLVEASESNSVCSSEFLPYYSDTIDLRLLAQLLSTEKITKDFIGMSTGTSNSQKRITPKNFLEYSVYMPTDINEQAAIADVLDDMDGEIGALEEKLYKAQLMKAGMMSELLTGRIRLIDKEDA